MTSEVPTRPRKAVVDGKPTYTSASSLQSADPSGSGCPRQWWYQKVRGLRTESTKSQAIGVAVHGEIENYLKTGENALGSIALAGLHHIPDPAEHQGLLVEERIWSQQITAAGIPLEGFIDLIVPEPADGVVEVVDWKTTGNIKWAKTGTQLANTFQMNIYARWAMERYQVDKVRLSHVYFQTKGLPRSVRSTIVVSSDRVANKWKQIEAVAESLHTLAAEEDIAKVPANRGACGNFGGCPFFDRCPSQGASEILFSMSVIDKKPEINTVAFKAAWQLIRLANRGTPPIEGEALEQVGYIEGKGTATAFAGGEGELGGLPCISSAATIIELAEELRGEMPAAEPEPEAFSVLPPGAPESSPLMSADPVEGAPEPVWRREYLGHWAEPSADPVDGAPEPEPKPEPKPKPKPKRRKPRAKKKPEAPTGDVKPTLYVNCIPSDPVARLEPFVHATMASLAAAADALDVRCSKNEALAFGAWKGALAAAVQDEVPLQDYTVTSKGADELEVVISALQGKFKIVRGF